MAVDDLQDLRATRNGGTARRVLRWLLTPLRPFIVVLVPDREVRPVVVAGRYGWPLLVVIACASLAAFAVGTRLDVAPEVRAENSGAPPAATKAGDPKPAEPEVKTDREIDEAITQRTAVARVKLGLGAAIGTPFRVLMLGVAVLLLGRFVGGKPTMPRALTVASLASVPGAVRSLVIALAAWFQPAVVPKDVDSLVRFPVASGPPVVERLLSGVDVFTVWSVIIVAVGLCAAADIKKTKSVVTIAIGFVLYLLVSRLIMGGAEPPPGVAGR